MVTTRQRARVIVSWVVLCIICAGVTLAFITPTKTSHGGINGYWKSSFVGMLKGTAYKPFVYRRLVPETVSIVVGVLPSTLETNMAEFVSGSPLATQIFERLRWDTEYALAYVIFLGIAYFCFLAFTVVASKFIIMVLKLPASDLTRFVLSCVLLLGLPPFFKFTTFIYDPPQLLLFAAALYYLYQRKWLPYIVLFFLACLNKETSILLIPIFVLYWPVRSGDRRSVVLAALQVAILVVIKAVLASMYRQNLGSFVETHFMDHNLLLFARAYGWTEFLLLVFLVFICVYRWREKPAFLRTALVWTLPPLVLLSVILGWVDEWRGYYEAYPVVLATAIHTFISLHRRAAEASLR